MSGRAGWLAAGALIVLAASSALAAQQWRALAEVRAEIAALRQVRDLAEARNQRLTDRAALARGATAEIDRLVRARDRELAGCRTELLSMLQQECQRRRDREALLSRGYARLAYCRQPRDPCGFDWNLPPSLPMFSR